MKQSYEQQFAGSRHTILTLPASQTLHLLGTALNIPYRELHQHQHKHLEGT
jgi:hypothetical protein